MKFPLDNIPCNQCGSVKTISLSLQDVAFDEQCPCGNTIVGSISATVGLRILYRSNHELMEAHDYSLSIVFSAMAFECELARLFFKCKEIDRLENGSQISDTDLEEELRRFVNIKKKIEEVTYLLDQNGIT